MNETVNLGAKITEQLRQKRQKNVEEKKKFSLVKSPIMILN